MVRKLRRSIVIALAASTLLLAVGVLPAAAGPENNLVNKVNAARAANGKDPVQVYWDLTDDARRHARRMADKQNVYTNSNIGSVTSGWKSFAEVVGVGPSAGVLFNSFMNTHRSTILGSYNYIGVGATVDADGILWVDMIFMRHPGDLVDDPPDETTTTTTTTTDPPDTTTTKAPPSSTTTTSSSTTTKPPAGGSGGSGDGGEATTTPTTTLDSEAVSDDFPIAPTTTAIPTTTTTTTSTTTTLIAVAVAPDVPPQAGRGEQALGGPLPTGDTATGGIGASWIVAAFIALGGAGFALVARMDRQSGTATTRRLQPAMAAGFDPCMTCGLVFDRGKVHICPNCGSGVTANA